MRRLVVLILLALCVGLAQAGAGEETVLRLGFETPRKDSQFVAAATFAKLVKERSGGRLLIKLFPDSVLGTGPAMLAAMRSGKLDIYMGGSGYFANFAQRLNVVDIPFLFRDYAHVDMVLAGAIGDAMMKELEPHGIKGLAFFENGFRCMTNSRRPIVGARDVAGMKIRTMDNPMHLELWKTLGATAVPMPLSELYRALETRTLDAQEHPLGVTYSARLFDVQRFISMTNHVYTPLIMAMSEKRFLDLGPEFGAVLVESAREAAAVQKAYNRENLEKQLADMKQAGCVVVAEGDLDIDSFREAVYEKAREMYLLDFGGRVGREWLRGIEDIDRQ